VADLCAWAARNRWVSLACLLGLALLALLPPEGLGIPICLFNLVSGLPCPGCGLTRSMASLAHGDPGAALRFHPAGLLAFPLLLGLVLLGLLAPPRREAVARWFERRRRAADAAGLAAAIGVAVYGVGRIVWILWSCPSVG
jgi:hypothetical protein